MAEGPRSLDYHGRDPDGPVGGLSHVAQMALGFGAYVAAVVVGGLVIAGSLWLGQAAGPGWSTLLGGGACVFWALLCPSMVILCVVARNRWGWEKFWVGVVLGLLLTVGAALLLIGLCFAQLGG